MKRILISFAATLVCTLGLACTCDYAGSFLKMSKRVDLVAVVEMIDYSDFVPVDSQVTSVKRAETVTFRIIKVIKGSEHRKEIKVFGDDGVLCRPHVQDFKKGRYYVIGLHKCANYRRVSGMLESPEFYSVSICGSYWIDYSPSTGTVTGIINKKNRVTTMTLERLEAILK